MLTNQSVAERLQAKFGTAIVSTDEQFGMLSLTVQREAIYAVVQFLRDDADLQFNFMTDLCGIHYPDNPKAIELGVIYHLHSWSHNFRIRLRTFFPRTDVRVPSMVPLYATANWMERETYDFFGVNFVGHPDLRRILNVDEMDFFPLRKEYPLEEQTRTDKDDAKFGREGNYVVKV